MASGGQSLKESNEGSKDSKALLSDVNTLYGDIITDSSEDELDIFEPIPYMFVLKDALGYPIRLSTSQIQNAKVICPPFHLLLDHLVAVLWIFYSRNGIEKLSTSHIHWALKFLEGIQTSKQTLSGYSDLTVIMNHLLQALIDMSSIYDENEIDSKLKNLESIHEQSVNGFQENQSTISEHNIEYKKFSKGILDGTTNIIFGPNVTKKKIPSILLESMLNNSKPEEIEVLFLEESDNEDDKDNYEESDTMGESWFKSKSKEKTKLSQKNVDIVKDNSSTMNVDSLKWKYEQIQKTIEQLEQIKAIAESLKDLKCDATTDALEKIKRVVDDINEISNNDDSDQKE